MFTKMFRKQACMEYSTRDCTIISEREGISYGLGWDARNDMPRTEGLWSQTFPSP